AIGLIGQGDESRFIAIEAQLPGQVHGIDRDTVATNARPGKEGQEVKGFGGCGLDHFPDTDAQMRTHQGKFIDQGDVDTAIRYSRRVWPVRPPSGWARAARRRHRGLYSCAAGWARR